jgi:hypothetical protein
MILRTYLCEECGHTFEAALTSDQWNQEPPDCDYCAGTPMVQEFKPPAIGGSVTARAHALAEEIARDDYHVGDMPTSASRGKVRYQDASDSIPPSTWATAGGQFAQAIALGRETRIKHGNGLDVLEGALKSGAQRDLIADSRRRSMKVW